jgi:hypothetical protein
MSSPSYTATGAGPSNITPAAVPGSPVAGDFGILAGSPDTFWFFNDTAVQYALTKPVDLYGSSPAALLVTKAAGADPTTDNCVKWVAGGGVGDAGAACGSGGSGDNISVNGTGATDADFDDSTPAAPANAINIKWQKDALTPNNLSGYVPYAAPLTVAVGNLTTNSSVVLNNQANSYTAGQKQTIPTADVSGTLRGKLTSDLQGDSSADFTIVQIPDPQCYAADAACSGSLIAMMTSFIDWIVAQKTAQNIQAVFIVGDIVNSPTAAQFTQQGGQIATLDAANIPVAVTPGNHDYTATNTRDLTGTGKWHDTFPATRWSGKSWWVDSSPAGDTESMAIKFDVDGKKYGILTMGMCPGTTIQTWAQGILDAETDRRWFMDTHIWLTATNGELGKAGDPNPCSDYFSTGNWAYPLAAWTSFAAGNDRQLLLIAGGHHIEAAYSSRRTDMGTHGYAIPQEMADYQNDTNGGNGYIRLLKVRPSLGIIEVKTYSPYLTTYKTDAWDQFTMPLASVTTLGALVTNGDAVVAGGLRLGATDLVIGDRFRFTTRTATTSIACPPTALCFNYPPGGNVRIDSASGTSIVLNQYGSTAGVVIGNGAGGYKLELLGTGQIKSTLAAGTAPMTVTSTTPVANLAATPTTYNAAGTQQVNTHLVWGTCTLGTSCNITLVGSAVFTSNTSYDCWPRDATTAANVVTVTRTSGSALAFTGTGTDVVNYFCVGN